MLEKSLKMSDTKDFFLLALKQWKSLGSTSPKTILATKVNESLKRLQTYLN